MSPILERLYALMRMRGVNAKQVTTELKLSNSSFTDWKKGKANPGVDALVRLSEYFGVSLDYLILGKDAYDDTLSARDGTVYRMLDISSPLDGELHAKFHQLPPDFQKRALIFIDGMLAALPPVENQPPIPVEQPSAPLQREAEASGEAQDAMTLEQEEDGRKSA